MALLEFDKLNTISLIEIPEERKRSEPYETYFGDMYLTEKQIEDREEVASRMEEPLRDFLLLIMIGLATGVVLYEEAREELLQNLIAQNIAEVEYLETLTADITDSTRRHPNDDWYFSEDRVIFISENEANTIMNGTEFQEARERGMTRKQWIGMKDKRERETHIKMNDMILPIDEYFHVGEAQCLYPKDVISPYTTLPEHPEELISCRCQIKYLK